MGIIAIAIILLVPTVCFSQELHEHPTIVRMHHVNNSIRQRFSLPTQSLSPRLTRAAQYQAEYMAKTHEFSHYVNGSPGIRAGKYGYDGVVVENIARSYFSVEETFYAWVDSPEHWHALSGSDAEVGYGYSIAADGTTYWVALYGTPGNRLAWTKDSDNSPTPSKVLVKPSAASLRQQNAFLLIGL